MATNVDSRVARGITTEELLGLHRAMVLSREIEEFCCRKTGHWYPSIGEEAAVVGTFSQLSELDVAAPHYRGSLIVQWLRGRPLSEVLGCILYSERSPTRGRLYGGFAGAIERGVVPFVTMVLGPSLAIAGGMALSFRLRNEPRVAVASFGDGTTGTGDFHESLNLAAALQLPVVFVCQNNQFSISTPASRALACSSIADWASRYNMPSQAVDGNDVLAVVTAARDGIDRARAGGGPSFVEALTYRRTGHFIADPAAYRDADEARQWELLDPIARVEELLAEDHRQTLDGLARVRAAVAEEVAIAAEEAESWPALTTADLLDEEGATP